MKTLFPSLNVLQNGGVLRRRQIEYSLQDGCVILGQYVCVPKQYHAQVLEEQHYGHLGTLKMKSIARLYVYWENIDKNINNMTKNCVDCARYKTNSQKVKMHCWEYPSTLWQCNHIDFAGPIFEHIFLIIVHCKWLKAYPIKSPTAIKTIEYTRDCFTWFKIATDAGK